MDNRMAGLGDLKNCVSEYCTRYNIAEFEVSDGYRIHRDWPADFPHGARPGCYAFFDDGGTLLYLGKASCGANIGRRAGTRFRWNKEKECVEYTGWKKAWEHVTVLHTIPVHEAHQAPSLEEYLIERLHPVHNRSGRKG